MSSDQDLSTLVQRGRELSEAAGQPATVAQESQWHAFVDRALSGAASSLPRIHKRFRVPLAVFARMVYAIDDDADALRYARFSLPPSITLLTAEQLDDPEISGLADEVMRLWRDAIVDVLPESERGDALSVVEADNWRNAVDPGDFDLADANPDDRWLMWDASTRAALASLPEEVDDDDRIALLVGLWSGAGRSPQIGSDWTKAEAWARLVPHVFAHVSDLGSARAWTMSAESPLYRIRDDLRMNAFVSWAYRRAGTWPTFTTPDPHVHQRLRETPDAFSDGQMWPDWVRSAVSQNRMESDASGRIMVVHKAPSVDDHLVELDALVGLDAVKAEIRSLVNLVELTKAQSAKGLPTAPLDLHMVFTGNPGTGKTSVARLYGQILRALGVLSSGAFVEVTRADLVGTYAGEASKRTLKAIEAADGGVLFIDEAYSLGDSGTGNNRQSKEVIDALVTAMETKRGSFAVVVAGYPGPMAKFLDTNPGLRSRFREALLFPDMSNEALLDALLAMARAESYRIDESALPGLRQWIKSIPRGKDFGNVREMRRLLGILKQRVADRYAVDRETAIDLIVKEDVPTLGPGTFNETDFNHAMDQLDRLVGIEPIKEVLVSLGDQARLAGVLRERGKQAAPIDVGHMVFVGNPGTGKTTAAGMVGQTLAAAGLLKGGHVHVVARADLVGEYLGQTAPKVRAAVQQALDGVLFIDEAYSLSPTRHDDIYLHEAVNTLVDEIERHRQRLVVIMAGYPKPMDKFLASNEGLRSRVRHHVEFPDFSREQLRDIALSIVRDRRMRITPEAAEAIADRVIFVADKPGFANARTVRNVVDDAKSRHARRIVKALDDNQETSDLVTIELIDVGQVKIEPKEQYGLYL